MARKLIVEIAGDSRSLERAFSRSEKSAKQFNTTLGKSLKYAAGFAAAYTSFDTLTNTIKTSIAAASDLNEQVSKTNAVFGKSADQVHAWAQTTASAFGTSQRQAEATAGSFGALFAPIGLVGEQAAKQSIKLTELGADLASFYNTNVQDALDAIRSGIVGESEPLRRYGVQLSETRVQQQALADTGKKHVQQLTAQEKTFARIEIIMRDTAKAQGDFARTSGGLANQSRILKANVDELEASLGETLLPTLIKVTHAMNDFFNVMKTPDAGQQQLRSAPRLEAALVPRLAKQIRQMRTAGTSSREILATLRRQLGGAPIANDLIAEAFAMSSGADRGRVKARIKRNVKQWAEDARKAADEAKRSGAGRGASVEQRNTWFDQLIGRQLDRVQDRSLPGQLKRLREIAAEVRGKLADTHDPTRRLNLADQLLDISRREKDVQSQITDNIKQGNQALRDRADAIKSAVLANLGLKQQSLEDKQQLQDATKALRTAQQMGGPMGIQAAQRSVQQAQYAVLRDRLEGAPASLKGGQFAYGGVTINVHGVTDPEKVARQVVAVIERRGRHGSTPSRGPTVDHSAPK